MNWWLFVVVIGVANVQGSEDGVQKEQPPEAWINLEHPFEEFEDVPDYEDGLDPYEYSDSGPLEDGTHGEEVDNNQYCEGDSCQGIKVEPSQAAPSDTSSQHDDLVFIEVDEELLLFADFIFEDLGELQGNFNISSCIFDKAQQTFPSAFFTLIRPCLFFSIFERQVLELVRRSFAACLCFSIFVGFSCHAHISSPRLWRLPPTQCLPFPRCPTHPPSATELSLYSQTTYRKSRSCMSRRGPET
jgi:hypothetical protein